MSGRWRLVNGQSWHLSMRAPTGTFLMEWQKRSAGSGFLGSALPIGESEIRDFFAKKFEDIEPRIKHGINTDSNPCLIRVPSVAADFWFRIFLRRNFVLRIFLN